MICRRVILLTTALLLLAPSGIIAQESVGGVAASVGYAAMVGRDAHWPGSIGARINYTARFGSISVGPEFGYQQLGAGMTVWDWGGIGSLSLAGPRSVRPYIVVGLASYSWDASTVVSLLGVSLGGGVSSLIKVLGSRLDLGVEGRWHTAVQRGGDGSEKLITLMAVARFEWGRR
jgi:hypothetical protein